MSFANEMRVLSGANMHKDAGYLSARAAAESFERARKEEERHWFTMVRLSAEAGLRFHIQHFGEIADPITRIREGECARVMSEHGFQCECGTTRYHSEESGEYRITRHVRISW